MTKKEKVKSQIRIMKPDLKDMIRDEIYAYALDSYPDLVVIPAKDVAKLAKRIAHRSLIGH